MADRYRQLIITTLPAVIISILIGVSCRIGNAERTATMLDVPFFRQTAYECGPSALASVLTYLGDDIEPEEISSAIFSSGARGTLTLDLVIFARNRGHRVTQASSSLEGVREEIEDSRPVILLVDEGFWIIRRGHFLVVTGYDAAGFYVHDGRREDYFVPSEALDRKWKRTNRLAILVDKDRI